MNIKDDQTFLTWIKTRVQSLKGVAFLVVSVFSAGFNLFVALSRGMLNRGVHMPILYGTQAAITVIVLTIIAFGQPPKPFLSVYKRGSRAVRQFWKWWPLLWVAWLLLYVGLTITELYANKVGTSDLATSNPIIVFGLHQLNNLATLILLMLFHILARPSVSEKEYPVEGDIFVHEQTSDTKANFETESIDADNAKFWFWVALFIVAAMFELMFIQVSGNAKEILFIYGISYGVIGATATALVVGKLDDHLLGVPTPVVVLLFLYAGIQPSFDFVLKPMADSLKVLATREVIIAIALISKIVLFATIQWLSMTDRLLYYMVQSYSLYKGVGTHRQNFLQKLHEAYSERSPKRIKN
jgi:hypothetical protein